MVDRFDEMANEVMGDKEYATRDEVAKILRIVHGWLDGKIDLPKARDWLFNARGVTNAVGEDETVMKLCGAGSSDIRVAVYNIGNIVPVADLGPFVSAAVARAAGDAWAAANLAKLNWRP